MAKHRSIIAEGAKTKGYDPALAEQLFDLMTKFAGTALTSRTRPRMRWSATRPPG